ncbi:GH25 family lysozyme [Romboutsia ilealis]|uniref:GH25 family lysozyme n=1 Tax=Romboutsia ilealis TaxID=1115758 RepID=UPI0023F07D22|nr:GH25 family lysozyme [Romboutsia ilealis]
MSYKGIDVSHYDGNINWRIVKEHIDFAILRLGWIGNTHHELDTKFEIYYNECKREGIPIGIYVYNYCNTPETAKIGANWAVNHLKGKHIDLPVYIDMEDISIEHLGRKTLTDICIAFNKVIQDAGYWAGVYANLNWYTNYLNKDIIKERYTTWIADYGVSEDRFEGQYDMLQYSETGRVPGISSNVDMNIMYRDLINEIKGSGTDPDPDPGTDKKTIEELAKEVIAGQWGSGEERKTRLTNAGYDYEAVQAKVNEILQSTDRKTVEELAKEVIAGQWGNGEERKTRLTNAGYDYAAVQAKVNEMLEENTSTTNYYKAVSSTYNSIVEALNSIGVDSSFNNRKQIAIKNGINDYTGTAEQNIELLNKLKDGKLIEI